MTLNGPFMLENPRVRLNQNNSAKNKWFKIHPVMWNTQRQIQKLDYSSCCQRWRHHWLGFRGQLLFHRWYLIWNMHAWQIWRKIRYEEEGKYLFLGIVSISDDMTMIPLNFSSFQPSAHHLWSPCICEGSDESYGVRNRKRHLPGTHTHIHIVKWMSVEPQILRWI